MPAEIASHLEEGARSWIQGLVGIATGYLEFGSGGSTLEALGTGAPVVVTVESDRMWADKVRAAAVTKSAPGQIFKCLHADIGPTREWGNPVGEVTASMSRTYVVDPFVDMGEFERAAISHAFIDGRWRVATAVASVLLLPNLQQLMVDDYRDRRHYHSVEEAIGADPEYRGRAALFHVGGGVRNPALLVQALMKHIGQHG